MDSQMCRLCFKASEQMMDVFNKNGIKLLIAEIISMHFQLTIRETDGYSSYVCRQCWRNTDNFHKFYNRIKMAQITNQSLLMTSLRLPHKNVNISISKNEQDLELLNLDDIKNMMNDCKTNDQQTSFIENNEFATKETDLNVEMEKVDKNQLNNISSVNQTAIEIIEKPLSINAIEPNDGNQINNNNGRIKNDKGLKNENEGGKLENDNKSINAKEIAMVNKKLQIELDNTNIREYFRMQCDFCNEIFSTFNAAKTHYLERHNISAGYIKCCKRKFFRRGRILDHIARHLNPDTFKCELCNKVFVDKTSLKNHIESHHASHSSKPFKCDVCRKCFLKKFQLQYHKKFRHYKEEDKKFVCDECGKSFMSKSILSSHKKRVHELAYACICDICAKIFKSKHIFDVHRQTHLNAELKPTFQCNICGSWFKLENNFRRHLARHKQDSIKHTCEICKKVTASKESLQNHIRYFHGERKYPCKLCDKAFKRPIGLKEHMPMHTGEILYNCVYCPKTFNSSANMHSHHRKVHPTEWQRNRNTKIKLNGNPQNDNSR